MRELHWDPSLAAICLNRLRCGEEQGQPEDPDGEAFAGAASPDGKEEPEPSADGVWQEVEEGVWEWQKNIQEEGNWQIDFQTVDLAGNLSSPVSTGETLDWSAPQLLDTAFTADWKGGFCWRICGAGWLPAMSGCRKREKNGSW